MKSFINTLTGVLIMFCAAYAHADTPATLEGATVVDAKKAKELMDADKSMAIIDTRVKVEYSEEHLPNAVSVVYGEKSAKDASFDATKDSFDIAKLPANKDQAMLIYCNGPECWKSYKGSKAAVKAGYKKVYWFRTGIPEWKKAGYPTAK